MSNPAHLSNKPRLLPGALLSGVSYYALTQSGPVLTDWAVNPVPAVALGLSVVGGMTTLVAVVSKLGTFFDWWGATRPTYLKGSAAWLESLSELGDDYIKHGSSPYFGFWKGRLRKRAVRVKQAAAAVTVGSTGSGKSTSGVIPQILSITEGKMIFDFKGSLTCQMAEFLRERGEDVRILNFANTYTDILGETDGYNPTSVISDCFKRWGGLRQVYEILDEMAFQIYPELSGPTNDNANGYFRTASRSMICFVILTFVFSDGEQATMGAAARLFQNRTDLLNAALWAVGRLEALAHHDHTVAGSSDGYVRMDLESSWWATSDLHSDDDIAELITRYRDDAERVVHLLTEGDPRTTDPFIEGAQQAMRKFAMATRGHTVTSSSTFRFYQAKDEGKTLSVFFLADANAMEAQAPLITLVQWCMTQELMRHPDKGKEVFLLCDEASNFLIGNLRGLLTYARGYGLRLHLFLQNFSSFVKRYDKATLSTLLSEADIFQFMPGTREPEVLDYVEKRMGHASIVTRRRRGQRHDGEFKIEGVDYSEESRPLMTALEISQCKKAILFIKNYRPFLADVPPYARVKPWRDQVGIDPFHGKPYRLRTKYSYRVRNHPLSLSLTNYFKKIIGKAD